MTRSLSEAYVIGDDTRLWSVRAETCPALEKRHIAHVGIGDSAVPLRVVRTNLSGAYLHASLGGEGRMLLDGRWRTHRPGMTSLAPSHVLHAFHAVPGKRWQYCWVRYMPSSPRSRVGAMAPVLAKFNPEPLRNAIMGLHCEMHSAADPGSCLLWAELIEKYVERFCEPWQREERIVTVWNAVRRDLGRAWTLDELALLANMSEEHLRRLCQLSFGRSPMRQLTYLRMQYAAHLLATTTSKIEAIAEEVGYQSSFSFSNTFTRMTGFRPSLYRLHGPNKVMVDSKG